jgi:hypothetical protein
MSLTTSTTWTNLIQEVLLPKVESCFFANNSLFNIWKPVPHNVGDSIDWAIDYGPSTDFASTYSEGDPAPNPNIETILKGTVAKQPFQVACSISKVALDYMGGNKLGVADPVLMDLEMKTKQLLNVVNTTLLASLEAAVDSTGSYTGNNAAVYTALASYEADPNTTFALSQIEDMYEALIDNDRGVDPGSIITLAPVNQGTNYARLSAGAAYFQRSNEPGGIVDSGRQDPSKLFFNGQPVYLIPDMTDTVILMGDRSKVEIREARPVNVEEKSVTADEVFFLLTCNYQIVLKDPSKWGKLTRVSA